MILQNLKTPIRFLVQTRSLSSKCKKSFKVAVLGAAGGIGQPLSLLLKQCPLIKRLNLQDIAKHLPGVALDVSHVETIAKVRSFLGENQISEAVDEVDIIVVPAGMPRKPGMSRDDLFKTNAGIIKNLADICSKCNPCAHFLIITNPVNSSVPIACEIYKKNCKDPCKIYGVTTLDISRANTFIANKNLLNPADVNCPVIGGHSGVTILPIISQCKPEVCFSDEEIEKLTTQIQNAGTEVVTAKAGAGSATLGMAYAAARFTISLLRAMAGEDVLECTYLKSKACPALDYFATPCKLGPNGVEENCGIPKLSKLEQKMLEAAIPVLKKEIQKGVDFVKDSKC